MIQFTYSQGLCISKKCFLPRVATSLLLPKVLIHFHIPVSLSCFLHPFLVSLCIWGPFLFFCDVWTFLSSTAGLPYFTYPACTSGLCSLQLCPQGGCYLPPHQKCTTFPFFPTFFPPSFYGERPRLVTPFLSASLAAYAQPSKWEEVAAGPTQAGGPSSLLRAPVPREEKCCCCSCHHPRIFVRELIHGMRVPSIAVLCFVVLLHLPAASPSSIPAGESGNLWRKEIICPSWAWQMTPWLRKFSNIKDYTVLEPILTFQICC